MKDPRGNPTSCDNTGALEIYEEALGQFQSYVGDAVATIDRALVEQPAFVLGHLLRAGVLMTFGERRFATDARTSLEAAEALHERASSRERALTGALRLLVDGDWELACARLDAVLVDYPRDVFALQVAHLFDFFRGDAQNLRNRVTRVLPSWSPAVPGYSYVLGMHAFGLEECHQYAEAEDTARRALALQPRDAWAIHAGAHVMEMRGRIEDGIAWLEARVADWAPENGLAYHNWWHLALFHLDRGNTTRVLELYDQALFATPVDLSLVLVDAASLLWRLHLGGLDVTARMAQIADLWDAKLDGERGFYAFNDVHALLAFVVTGREDSIERQLAAMERATADRTSNAAMTREVGMPVGRALRAFGAGRYGDTVRELELVRDRAHRFGGSHAQRDVLTLTLIEAATRDGRSGLARHYLAERHVHRPASALGWRLAARA